MKTKLILGLVLCLMMNFCFVNFAMAENDDLKVINSAIKKYKDKNYLGCISELTEYTEKNPTSVAAWYYLGNSYMNIAMQDKANEAFEKVITINSVPQLTSYSIQAQLCMKDPTQCEYKIYTLDEIEQLKLDPVKFLAEYNKPKEPEVVVQDPKVVEINRLINGEYPGIHPDADNFIRQESLKIESSRMN